MDLEQIDALSDAQIEQLHAMYQNEWWTQGRELSDVRRMLEQTDINVGLVDRARGRLVAFCRVLTDFTYHATLYDVIVVPSHRDRQLGRQLMEVVIHHPQLQSVGAIWLCCLPGLIPFYRKWGFSEAIDDLTWMRRVQTHADA